MTDQKESGDVDEIPDVGSTVRGFRVIGDGTFSKSVAGEVTKIHDPYPVPRVDESVVIVNDASDGKVPVRVSNIEEVVNDG